jgi:peptide-methionine (R)-S-oxide reductase
MRITLKLKSTLSGLLALLAVACAPAPDRSAAADPAPVKTSNDAQRAAETRSAMTTDAIRPLEKPHEEWKPLVPADSYRVLFEEGTEPPFSSPLNEEKREGTFICAACNLPLFSSDTKFNSGTGWPSFFEPIPGRLGTDQDLKMMIPRTEYHCIRCGGHQGHVFDDGPAPTGLRYCNNGDALRFVPRGEALPELRS